MFGLTSLFAAFRRLTSAVNRTAELFEQGNLQLEGRMTIHDDAPALPAPAPMPASMPTPALDATDSADGPTAASASRNGRRGRGATATA